MFEMDGDTINDMQDAKAEGPEIDACRREEGCRQPCHKYSHAQSTNIRHRILAGINQPQTIKDQRGSGQIIDPSRL